MNVELATPSQSPCTSALPITSTTAVPMPFEVHPTYVGCVQLHLVDGFNGFECISDLVPAQIDSLIAQLMTARTYHGATLGHLEAEELEEVNA